PVESELARFIPEIDKLSNFLITHPKPIVLAYTKPISDWTILISKIQVSTSNSIIEDTVMEDIIYFNGGNNHQDIEENGVRSYEQNKFIYQKSAKIEAMIRTSESTVNTMIDNKEQP
ncbi:702_t:CDS:2, partial [Scutellospora calospora]